MKSSKNIFLITFMFLSTLTFILVNCAENGNASVQKQEQRQEGLEYLDDILVDITVEKHPILKGVRVIPAFKGYEPPFNNDFQRWLCLGVIVGGKSDHYVIYPGSRSFSSGSFTLDSIIHLKMKKIDTKIRPTLFPAIGTLRTRKYEVKDFVTGKDLGFISVYNTLIANPKFNEYWIEYDELCPASKCQFKLEQLEHYDRLLMETNEEVIH